MIFYKNREECGLASEFREIAGRSAKAVGRQVRQRGFFISLSDEEVRSFLSGVVDPQERLEAYMGVRPHRDQPRVPRKRRVQDGFGGKRPAGQVAGVAFMVGAIAAGEGGGGRTPRQNTVLHGGFDSVAGRLLIELNPVTSGCEHIMAVTTRHLILVRVRSGVGRKLGPAIVPWWVPRDQVPATRRHGKDELSLGFADSSWIRLYDRGSGDGEAVRTCFPDAPGPWPGDT